MVGRLQKGWILLVLIGLIIGTLGCQFLLPEELETTTFREVYLIEPQMLLTSLANGDPDAFVPLTATPPVYPDFAQEPVQWTVEDYFFIAKAFYEHATNKTLDGFNLRRMSFRSACDEIDYGFQGGNFSFFKSVSSNTENSRIVENLFVDPNENVTILHEVLYSSAIKEWDSIDLETININAWEALQIAEQNGGNSFRDSVNNECSVLVDFDKGSKFDHWWVSYFVEGSNFDLNIDAVSGEFRILR